MDSTPISHYPGCFGCGSEVGEGLKIQARTVETAEGVQVHGVHVPPDWTQSGPGIAHGGHLASVADEMLGLAAATVDEIPPMGRRIEVEYLAPSRTGDPLTLAAWVDSSAGRRVNVVMTAAGPDGSIRFRAFGLFIRVDLERWLAQVSGEGVMDTNRLHLGSGNVSEQFAWYRRWVVDHCSPVGLDADTKIALDLSDVEPNAWTMAFATNGIGFEEGADPEAEVTFRADFRTWQDVLSRAVDMRTALEANKAHVHGDLETVERAFRSLECDVTRDPRPAAAGEGR